MGETGGNVNLFGYRMDLLGKVEKTARLFGNTINISGETDGNLLAFGNEIYAGEKSVIGRDLNCFGQRITIDGIVKGNAKIKGANVIISGTIEGNTDIEAEKLLIIPPAIIKGTLYYVSENEAVIEEGAVIQGEKTWKLPEEKKREEEEISFFSVLIKIGLLVMAFITGLLLIWIFGEHTREAALQIEKNFWVVLAAGCLTLIACSAGAMVLLILLITIPISIFLLSLGLILFYVGKVYVGIILGRLIFRLLNKHKSFAIGWELLLGLIVLTILFQIPIIGWIVYILTFILGMGAGVNSYISLGRRFKSALKAAPSPESA